MNQIITIVLFALIMMMLFRNIMQAKNLKKTNEYVETYMGILRETEGAKEKIKEYYEKETNPELKSKTLIVMIYEALKDGEDVNELLSGIDLTPVIFDKDKVTKESIIRSSDAFLWAILDFTKAYNKGKMEEIKPLYELFAAQEEALNNTVEYNVLKASYNALANHKDYEFFNTLLTGDYAGYLYDKQMIGTYKKISASLLDFIGEQLSEDDLIMVKGFATTRVGLKMLVDLGTYDKFKEVIEEPTEETKEIEEPKEEKEEEK